jgi:predicted RNA-binding protein with EMAP domain
MKEYWITPEEAKEIIEVNNLIDKAIEEIKFYSRSDKDDFDEYDVMKVVYKEISDIMESVDADKVWWTEDCNKCLFQMIMEKMYKKQ